MKKELIKIISSFGVLSQLKYFQSEVFELNEAIIRAENKYEPIQDIDHIAEEIADVEVMLLQFKEYYHIDGNEILEIMKNKIKRTLERIESGYYEK